jgi:hypothetical protein
MAELGREWVITPGSLRVLHRGHPAWRRLVLVAALGSG